MICLNNPKCDGSAFTVERAAFVPHSAVYEDNSSHQGWILRRLSCLQPRPRLPSVTLQSRFSARVLTWKLQLSLLVFAAFLTFLFRVFLDLQKHLSRISGFYPRKQKTGTTEATKQHPTLDREGSKYSFRQHVAVKVLFFCFYRSINDFKYFQQLTQGSSALHVSVSLGVYLFLNVQMSQIQFNINNLHEWNLDWNKNTFMYIWTFWFHPSESKKTFYSHNSRLWPLNWNKWCFFHLQLHLRWNYIIT